MNSTDRKSRGSLQRETLQRSERSRRNVSAEATISPLMHVARSAASCSAEQKLSALSAVIDELLIANELGLAYQLARCLEARGVQSNAVSARMIRTLSFARMVQNADGSLGSRLREDLEILSAEFQKENASDSRSAQELFLRAASLTPALVLSSSPVVELLRSFPLDECLPQLSNLCIRIALASRRLGGKAKSVFATSMPPSQWQQSWKQLQTEIREWIHRELDQRFDFQTVKPIFLENHWTVTPTTVTRHPEIADRWAFWQLGLTRLSTSLKPLLEGEPLRRRNHVIRLLQALREESILAHTSPGIDSPHRFEGFQQLQQSAIVLVERWIRLVDRHPKTNQYLPQEANDLQTEILKRSPSIDRECQEVKSQLVNRHLIAGVEGCRRAVLSMQDCVAETSMQLDREPHQIQLLSLDLLRVPQLVLDQQWLPLATAERLENKLLEALANGLPDWQTALATHQKLGNHKAARRIERVLNSDLNLQLEPVNQPNGATQALVASEYRQIGDDSESQLARFGGTSDETAWIWDFENS